MLSTSTNVITKTFERPATESDVARFEAWQEARDNIKDRYGPSAEEPNEKRYEDSIALLGAAPPRAVLGEPIQIVNRTGGQSIYWRGGLAPVEGEVVNLELVEETDSDGVNIRVEREVGNRSGSGSLNVDFLLYSVAGIDLSGASKATLETLRLPSRLLLPFLVLILLSFLTPRHEKAALDRYFAKMNTPVRADHDEDKQVLEEAYAHPEATERRKIFPGSDWEFVWPSTKDLVGFLAACAVCFLIIGLLTWLASIGAN